MKHAPLRFSIGVCELIARLSEINRGDELCELQTEGVGNGGKERGDRNVDSPPSLRSYWVELSETGAPGKLELARDTRRSLVSGDTCRSFHLLNDKHDPHLHTILELSLTISQTRKKKKHDGDGMVRGATSFLNVFFIVVTAIYICLNCNNNVLHINVNV